MNRRRFLAQSSLATAGLTILPSGIVRGQSADNKLNIALIGVWGRGIAHHGWIAQENLVALCDVDEDHLALALKKFPKAQPHTDWRKCLEQKDLDAVVIATPDHHHAFISNWALIRSASRSTTTAGQAGLPITKERTSCSDGGIGRGGHSMNDARRTRSRFFENSPLGHHENPPSKRDLAWG